MALVGTVAFLTTDGVFVTAKHVFMNGDVPEPGLAVIQLPVGDKFYVREVWQVTHHPFADIAIGMLLPGADGQTGAPLVNETVSVTANVPSVDDVVVCAGYHKTTSTESDLGRRTDFRLSSGSGQVVEEFLIGRDGSLPGPCVHVTAGIGSGASGGPAFDRRGRVFGVNSTGFDVRDGEVPITYVTPLREAMDLFLRCSPDQYPGTASLREMIRHGFVRASDT